MKSWHFTEKHPELGRPQLTQINGARSTPILPEAWILEYVAVCILRHSERKVKGSVLPLTEHMRKHMINGNVTVTEDDLIALRIERPSRGRRRPAVAALDW